MAVISHVWQKEYILSYVAYLEFYAILYHVYFYRLYQCILKTKE